MTTHKVGYFVGSLSSTSINRILSKALIRVAPDDLEFSEKPIGNLPRYSQDFDNASRRKPERSRRRSLPSTRSCSSPPSTTVPSPER